MQKLISFRSMLVMCLLMTLCLAFTGCVMPVDVNAANGINPESPECNLPESQSVITSPYLSVLTLNLAHGRKDALNQLLQKTSTTRRNLEQIADFLSNSGADLVALQEADSPSRWSGEI